MTEPYLVHVRGRGEPKVIQWGEDNARKEAIRLAKIEPSRVVCVYKLVAQYEGIVNAVEIPKPTCVEP